MISFRCTCGEPFEVPEDCAGESLQCPVCRRLMDVPRLGDIGSFDTDGSVRLGDALPRPEDDLLEKIRVFSHGSDLRQDIDSFFALDDVPLVDERTKPSPPRYDPESGELMLPIELDNVKAPPRPQDIPMAKPALNYASNSTPGGVNDALEKKVTWWTLPGRLLMGPNIVAIAFIVLMHLLVVFISVIPLAQFLLLIFNFMLCLTLATHYFNVIEDFGPQEREQVPVLLRTASLSEDVFEPLKALLVSALFSFGLFIFFSLFGGTAHLPFGQALAVILATAGLLVFPAAALTATTSGVLQNMLPHHVLSVIIAAPVRYLCATLAFLGGAYAYLVALAACSPILELLNFGVLSPFGSFQWNRVGVYIVVMIVAVSVAVYLMHLCATWLGLLYREHHGDFNWAYQERMRVTQEDVASRLREMRAKGDPRVTGGRRQPGGSPVTSTTSTASPGVQSPAPQSPQR